MVLSSKLVRQVTKELRGRLLISARNTQSSFGLRGERTYAAPGSPPLTEPNLLRVISRVKVSHLSPRKDYCSALQLHVRKKSVGRSYSHKKNCYEELYVTVKSYRKFFCPVSQPLRSIPRPEKSLRRGLHLLADAQLPMENR